MYIKELDIKNYGKFNDNNLKLNEGINVIYGENESGKSTLFSFIKSMIFGLERARGTASRNDEYSIYEPWDNATYYEGRLRFIAGGKSFRLERGFSKANKYAILINEDDGEELDIEKGDLYSVLDGMTESIFLSTVATKQKSIDSKEQLKSEFRNYTSNCANLSDNPIDIDKALDSLKLKKREIQSKIRTKEYKKTELITKKRAELKYIEEELQKKNEQLVENIEKIKLRENDIAQEISKDKIIKAKDYIIFVVTAVIAVLLAMLSKKYVLCITGAIAVCLVRIFYNFIKKKAMEKNIVNVYDNDVEIQKCQGSIQILKEDIKSKKLEMQILYNEIEELDKKNESVLELEAEVNAIDLASDKINEAMKSIQDDTTKELNEKVSTIFSKITNNKYKDIKLDLEFNSLINTQDKLINSTRISEGSKEELDFSVRMAVSKMFFEDEKMPIITDDGFVMYDDKRLAATLEYINSMNTQAIIFTCHKREKEILDSKGITYNYIELAM